MEERARLLRIATEDDGERLLHKMMLKGYHRRWRWEITTKAKGGRLLQKTTLEDYYER